MLTLNHPTIRILTVIALTALTGTSAFSEDRLPLDRIDAICYPAGQEDTYGGLAYGLRAYLKYLFDVQPPIKKERPAKGSVAIVLGRELAEACKLVTADELESVRTDGYIIRVTDGAVALAGYGPQGTSYAVWRLFRMAGAKTYPGQNFIRPNTSNPSLPITTVKDKPYFEFRDCRGDLDRGVCGTTLRKYSLGSAKEAANQEGVKYDGWLGWDHTAGYLVPKSLYYEKHPEYFAQRPDGSRPAPKAASTATLCTSNPAVRSIMVDRAMKWMSMQDNRQLFAITEGDSAQCLCDNCRALDLHPYYTTDRLFKWVNPIARAAAKQHPDKTLMTFAYIRDVKPPVKVKPEPNVVSLYAPWVWTSRGTSAVTWAHPLNITAMDEFLSWSMTAPGQIGVYDYIYGNWRQGTADRIKFWARHGAKWVYMNAPPKDPLFVWVCASLLWNPFQDVETLHDQFMDGYYGPAAEPMAAYHALRESTIQRDMIHDVTWGRHRAYIDKAGALLDKAQANGAQGDERTQKRITTAITTARKELEKLARHITDEVAPIEVTVTFDQPDETASWLTDGSEAISLPPQPATVRAGDNTELRGVRVTLPMSQLPTMANSLGQQIHAGLLYAERSFAEPIDASGCWFVEFHLAASAPVACQVVMHGASRSFLVHPGEQILRMDLRHFMKNAYFDREKWNHQVERVGFRFSPVSRDKANDAEIVFFGMRCSNQLPEVKALPRSQSAIWLSQFRPNRTSPGLITGSEAPDVLYKTRGERFDHPTGSRWRQFHGGRIKFRSFMPHATMTPIYAIHADGDSAEAAALLQKTLQKLFHVKLPVRKGSGANNCITISSTIPDARQRKFAGDDGFVIDVRDGRAVIAGNVMQGVIRYLNDYDVVVDARGRVAVRELHAGHRGLLHELYVIDKPWFSYRPGPIVDSTANENEIVAAADLIKQAARNGATEPPSDALAVAQRSPLGAYVISQLLWNPLTDTSRLLREGRRDFSE